MSFLEIIKDNIKRISYSIIIITWIIILYASYHRKQNDINTILNNYSIIKGEVTDYGKSGISGRFIDYKYIIQGKEYCGSMDLKYNLSCESGSSSYCVGRKYPVIFSVEYPEKSYMLVERCGYELFNLPVPANVKR